MKILYKKIIFLLVFGLSMLSGSAQNLDITGSCIVGTDLMTFEGDTENPTFNGNPVYYNGMINLNYQTETITAQAYLYYALATELSTPENRWVVAYDGQPYYYFISDASTPPLGEYLPFDDVATVSDCGGSVFISIHCDVSQILTGVVPTSLCAGSAISVPFTASCITIGNIFTAQLSDASGSFATPVVIGTLEDSNSGNISSIIPANTPAGSAYRIRVISSTPSLIGEDNGSAITVNPFPLGDTFATAIDVTTPTYSTTGDTSQCYTNTIGNPSPDVWYRVTLDVNAVSITVSTCTGTTYDSYLRVYAADGTTLLGENDDACGLQSTMSNLDVSVYDVVYVVVEGYSTDSGAYGLTIIQSIPGPGDLFATAIEVTTPTYSTTGTTIGFTNTIGNLSPDVWYRVTLDACTSLLNVSTCTGTNYDSWLRVYAADGITELASNDDSCGLQSTISNLDVSAHDVVYVLVEGFSSNSGVYGLTIDQVVEPLVTYYADADEDGFGDAAVSIESCTGTPMGYVLVNTDCDDTNNTVYPGASEICYDGIDQNCNGALTDGCAVITATLRSEDCGATLTSIGQVVRGNLYSQSIPSGVNVTGYRFKVTNLITLQERIVERSNYVFQLTYTDFADYNTPYSVEVELRLNQEWMGAYGAACTITTPGVPNTVLTTTSCGATLAQMNNIIRAVVVPSALQYEYNVALIEGGVPVETTTLVRSGESFNLLQLSGISIKYASEYSVTIRVQVPTSSGPQWSTVAGAACSVFTPAAPEAAIEGCSGEAGIAPANLNTVVYASPVGGATQYRFTLTDGMGYSQVYTTPSRFFRLSNFNALAALTPGGTYSVTVAVEIYGNFYPGKDCNILVPGGAPIMPIVRTTTKPENTIVGEFKAIAYPNPFATSFSIDLKSNSTSEVSLAIYDMTGRLLETRAIKADGLANQTIGERYPAGIYNVIVNQGENTQTIRVVKQ